MGANEKFEAAMHGGEYVPNTDAVRSIYSQHRNVTYADFTQYRAAEFDLWLATVRAEAKREALTDMAHVLEADIPGHAHENGQIIAGRNIIRIIRARANQYKEQS